MHMVTDLSILDISAKHCIIHNGYCYNNPSHGFHTNINILSIRYEVLLYIKTYHQLLPAIALYGESSVYCRWCSWNLVDILCVDFKYFSKQLMEQLFSALEIFLVVKSWTQSLKHIWVILLYAPMNSLNCLTAASGSISCKFGVAILCLFHFPRG